MHFKQWLMSEESYSIWDKEISLKITEPIQQGARWTLVTQIKHCGGIDLKLEYYTNPSSYKMKALVQSLPDNIITQAGFAQVLVQTPVSFMMDHIEVPHEDWQKIASSGKCWYDMRQRTLFSEYELGSRTGVIPIPMINPFDKYSIAENSVIDPETKQSLVRPGWEGHGPFSWWDFAEVNGAGGNSVAKHSIRLSAGEAVQKEKRHAG